MDLGGYTKSVRIRGIGLEELLRRPERPRERAGRVAGAPVAPAGQGQPGGPLGIAGTRPGRPE